MVGGRRESVLCKKIFQIGCCLPFTPWMGEICNGLQRGGYTNAAAKKMLVDFAW